MSFRSLVLVTTVSAGLLGAACEQSTPGGADARVADPASVAEATLKEAFRGHFLVGAALNGRQFTGADPRGPGIIDRQFNTITPENILKWQLIHPEPDRYAFEGPDRYVAFGEERGMFIVGHTLVWHNQTPRWVFEDESGNAVSRDTLIARMRDHIHAVVGRYRGRIHGWDVVNEALNEDGTLRESPWMQIIGEDYLVLAFQFAHEADPDAELYYNDYALPNAAKRDGAVRLIRRLQAAGVPVTGIGMQAHYGLADPPVAQVDSAIAAFAALGIDVMITELDIDVLPEVTREVWAEVADDPVRRAEFDPYTDGLPDEVHRQLAARYADLFRVFVRHSDHIPRVTFWGVTDGDSWKNNWPVRGRKNYPLLFGRDGLPKPAFDAVIGGVAG